jgi:hypothetical protein
MLGGPSLGMQFGVLSIMNVLLHIFKSTACYAVRRQSNITVVIGSLFIVVVEIVGRPV